MGKPQLTKNYNFPTQESLQWVIQELIPETEKPNIIIQPNPSSVARNATATIITSTDKIFTKQLSRYWNHIIESTITKILSPHPATLTYLADNSHYKIIATQYITPKDTIQAWNMHEHTRALQTLDETQTILTETPLTRNLSLPLFSRIPSHQNHSLRGLHTLETKHNIPYLPHISKNNTHQLIQLAKESLQHITNEQQLIPQHTDATSENWILTRSTPILIDYGTYALAPYYWDHAFLTTTSPLPPNQKIDAVLHYKKSSTKNITIHNITHTAVYFLLLLLSLETDPEHNLHHAWIQKYLRETVKTLHAIHPNLFAALH